MSGNPSKQDEGSNSEQDVENLDPNSSGISIRTDLPADSEKASVKADAGSDSSINVQKVDEAKEVREDVSNDLSGKTEAEAAGSAPTKRPTEDENGSPDTVRSPVTPGMESSSETPDVPFNPELDYGDDAPFNPDLDDGDDVLPTSAPPNVAPDSAPDTRRSAEATSASADTPPPHISAAIDAAAAGDERKRERLYFLWRVYMGDSTLQLPNGVDPTPVMERMRTADNSDLTLDEAVNILNSALEMVWPAGPAGPDSGPIPVTPDPVPPDSEQNDEQESNAELSPERKQELINEFLERKGYRNNREAAVFAIRVVLNRRIEAEEDMTDMEAFLKSAVFENDIDREARETDLSVLEADEAEITMQMEDLVDQIKDLRKQCNRKKGTPAEKTQLKADLQEAREKKLPLAGGLRRAKELVTRKKMKKTKGTVHQRTPEQLLGMINMHFAKQELDDPDETPDYTLVLAETQEQLESARDRLLDERAGVGAWFGDILEPRLTSVLRTVVEKDKSLKKVTAEEIDKLIDSSDNRGGVETWIEDLEDAEGKDIPEKEKMEKIVPTLIGQLAYAVSSNRLNTYSRENGRNLLSHLRHVLHTHSMKEAKKASGEKGTDKMNAYFESLNELNGKAAKAKHEIVENFARRCRRGKMGLPIAAGALATSTIFAATIAPTGLALGAIGVAMGSGAAAAGSFKVQKPETKAWLRRNAVRGLAAGGIGALAVGITPWIAAPLAVGGFFAPNLWKNKAAIGAGGVAVGGAAATVGGGAAKLGGKGIKAAAPVAGRLGLWGVPRAIAAISFVGLLPLIISERYRNWFFSLPKLKA